MNIKNVLIVSAHPDDYELGMGMRIKKYTSAGVRVTAITATVGEYKDSPRGRIKQEKEAGRILGIQEQINLELPCSRLSEFSIDFRNRVEKIVNDIKPDIAYTIYPNDLHVDHEVVSIHSLVAFRSVKNVVYYRVAYSRGFSPNLFFFGNKLFPDFGFTYANPSVTATLAIILVIFPTLVISWILNKKILKNE